MIFIWLFVFSDILVVFTLSELFTFVALFFLFETCSNVRRNLQTKTAFLQSKEPDSYISNYSGLRIRLNYFLFCNPKAHVYTIPAEIYLLKVNNRKTRTRCEICSKLTIKIPEWRHWREVFGTYFTPCSSVSIVNFEHKIASWDKMSNDIIL